MIKLCVKTGSTVMVRFLLSLNDLAVKVDELHRESSKPWLASYPSAVRSEIDPEYHRSLAAFVEENLQRFAHRPALRSFGQTLTDADLDRCSDRVPFSAGGMTI